MLTPVAVQTNQMTGRRLTAPSAIVLVSCYELGHQPLSLAAPLALLRRAGFAPVAVDTAVEELDDQTIQAAQLVAIAVPMHTALRLGTRVAARVRTLNPAAHICFYGLYATLNADHLLTSLGDSVISGEYEGPLLALAHALDQGESIATVPGVGTRNRPAPPALDPLPADLRTVVPARQSLPPPRRYAGLERDGTIVPAGYIEATRGCHHLCLHCPIPPIYEGRLVVVPRAVVLADARAQIAAGVRHLTFGDPDFFNGPGHGLRIMQELHAEFPWLTFDVTIKVEHLLQHRQRVPALAEFGCAFVVSAVESLSERVLTKLAKGHTRADVETALAILDVVNLPMRPSLLPFTPWATLDDYLALLTFFAERDLVAHVDPIQFAIRLLVPPGSSLLAEPTTAEWLGSLDQANFTYRWRHPDPRMDELSRAISTLVEAAAARNEPIRDTFSQIWETAHAAANRPTPPLPAPHITRRPPPRLTESWFC
jgi:radical SAM superfamily enzyme YgiQ (UPF0313 family)